MEHQYKQKRYFFLFTLSSFITGLSNYFFDNSFKILLANTIEGDVVPSTLLAVNIKAAFTFLGGILAIFLLEKFDRQLKLAAVELIVAILFFIYPFCTSYKLFLTITAVHGLFYLVIDLIPVLCMVEMYRGKVNHISISLQIMFFFKAFEKVIYDYGFAPDINQNFDLKNDVDDKFYFKYSRLWVPYVVFAIIKVCISLTLVVLFYIKPFKKKLKDPNAIEDENKFDLYEEGKKTLTKTYSFAFVFVIGLLSGFEKILELNSSFFLFDRLAVDGVIFGVLELSGYNILVLILSLISKLLVILIGYGYQTHTMLTYNFVTMFFAIPVLGILQFVPVFTKGLMFGLVLLLFGFSNVFTMLLTLIEERLVLCPRKICFFYLINYFFMISYFWIFELVVTFASTYYFVISLGLTTLLCIVFGTLILYYERKRLTDYDLNFFLEKHF